MIAEIALISIEDSKMLLDSWRKIDKPRRNVTEIPLQIGTIWRKAVDRSRHPQPRQPQLPLDAEVTRNFNRKRLFTAPLPNATSAVVY